MTLNLTVVQPTHTDFTPRISVIGVGGGGTNAVDNMIAGNLQGVEFIVANTDAQQLMHSRADRRIQLGPHITQGLGAGAKPEIGRAAAEEAADDLMRQMDGAHMLFITAGMGGGTGTGAAPVIARMAKERGILTVGVVTRPFDFEGKRRQRAAEAGIEELQHYVDTLIVIPNQNLFRMATERTTWREAFKMADQVLYMGVRGVTDLMMAPGLVNLDFADIRTVMAAMGKAMMGTGEAEGENRAIRAAEAAINNPLLEDTSMSGARGLLINITGGDDLTLYEVDQAANRIREEVDDEAEIIFGSAIDESLEGRIRVSVVATGIDTPAVVQTQAPRLKVVGGENRSVASAMQRDAGFVPAAATVAAGPIAQLRATASEHYVVEPMEVGEAPESVIQEPAVAWADAPQRIEPTMAPIAEPATQPRHRHAASSAGAFSSGSSPMGAFSAGMAASVMPSEAMTAGAMTSEAMTPEAMTQAGMTERQTAFGAPSPTSHAHAHAHAHGNTTSPRGGRTQSSTLFASEQPMAAMSQAPSHPTGAEPHRSQSLFGRVTGRLGFRQSAEPATPPRAASPDLEPASEPARPTVRQTTAEDIGIGIPNFLLRQTSGTATPPRR